MIEINEIVEVLEAKRAGAGWMAKCPAHDDKEPSLSILVSDGKLLMNCFAGCSFDEILGALGR